MKSLAESLITMKEWQQLALGAAMVERMAPNYQLFCELSGAADSRQFGNILNLVWEYASGDNQKIDFAKQLDKLESLTPDPEQFDIYGVWPALDAAVSLSALLTAAECCDIAELENISEVSRSTIEKFIQATSAETDNHPLLLADRQFTADVIDLLHEQAASCGRKAVVKSLRNWVQGFEHSNIGLVVGD